MSSPAGDDTVVVDKRAPQMMSHSLINPVASHSKEWVGVKELDIVGRRY